LFFSNAWQTPSGLGVACMLYKEGGGAPKPWGIGRLTSDIGPRPNASCPAGSTEVTVAGHAAGTG
jgi:hypothetical protein